MLRMGRQNIDIPAGEKNYTIVDSFVLPVDVEVQALQPHAHYRAHDVLSTATLPDGTTRTLLHITDWDYGFQHLYRYVTPFALPKGTTLAMRYISAGAGDRTALRARAQQPGRRAASARAGRRRPAASSRGGPDRSLERRSAEQPRSRVPRAWRCPGSRQPLSTGRSTPAALGE